MPKAVKKKQDHADEDNYLQKFTVAVFGASGVGKTALIRRLLGLKFVVEHFPTVEDFHVKHVAFKNKTCELQIIDTSGTYEFPAMRKVSIQKADAVILVYSMDKPESFLKLERYVEEIAESKGGIGGKSPEVPVVIVSNKSDIPDLEEPLFKDKRGMNIAVGLYFERKWSCQWTAASAKTNDSVDDIFYKVLGNLFKVNSKHRTPLPVKKFSNLIHSKIRISR